jgi:hypothetical protein
MSVNYDEIAKRAFEIWEREGRPPGRDLEHWLAAEAELRQDGLKKQRGKKIESEDPAMLKTPRKTNGRATRARASA